MIAHASTSEYELLKNKVVNGTESVPAYMDKEATL